MRRALRLSRARVIACCKYVAEPFSAYLAPGQLSIIYNGVAGHPGFFRNPSATNRRIGVIGRIEREKGQLEFVLAARSVIKFCPNCRFSIIGAPMFSKADYLNKVVAASHGLPIEFLGWRDDIPSLLSNLDLLVVPSSSIDATTRVIIEAFAAGVPVVAFPSGGIPEILHDGKTGFLARAHTTDALAERIISVLGMPSDDVQSVVNLARKRWREDYALDAYRLRAVNVISEVADRDVSQRRPWKSAGRNVQA
jgi:glycosyltransferase involved in cell wall biosynthesis